MTATKPLHPARVRGFRLGRGFSAITAVIHPKNKVVLSHEQQVARTVADQMVQKPEISVWMFLFPVILIPFFQQYQTYREAIRVFCNGYLFTKKMALDVADKICRENQPKPEALAAARVSVSPGPGTGDQTTGVREKQMKEVDLLTDHYCALLRTPGENYQTLIRNAYGTLQNYSDFLGKLEEAEREVNLATIRDLGSQVENLPNTISKMEQSLARVRSQEAQRIFSGVGDSVTARAQ